MPEKAERRIKTLTAPLNARVQVPGSKSETNRSLVLAALADGVSVLKNVLVSDDSNYLISALQSLGFQISQSEDSGTAAVQGLGGLIPADRASLFIGNAGTAARFLTAFLCLGKGEYILDGEQRMRERPIGSLLQALNQLGGSLSSLNSSSPECPPLQIMANGLAGGTAQIDGSISSQYLSALLMAAPYAESAVEIEAVGELNSAPYIELTISMMETFGISIQRPDQYTFIIHPGKYKAQPAYSIESDASAASYFFAAPAICGGRVLVKNISRASRQGDIQFLDILARMGCTIQETSKGISVISGEHLEGIKVDMKDISDTAQTLAAVAPFASSPTTIRGIASSRRKETDRISAVCTELRRLGVQVEEFPDGMTIHPCAQMKPSAIKTYNDHRMAMAFSLIGLRMPGISIQDPSCVSKTFPEYFSVLEGLR